MNPSFNPYHEFLGLDPRLTAPTYYQLLGLVPEESDPARITAAAERALAQVRGCRPGQQAAAWARLLDELTAAIARNPRRARPPPRATRSRRPVCGSLTGPSRQLRCHRRPHRTLRPHRPLRPRRQVGRHPNSNPRGESAWPRRPRSRP